MWIEYYGPITKDHYVQGNEILKRINVHTSETIHTFRSNDAAIIAYKQWQQESKQVKTSKEYKFNLTIKLSPKDVEDIIREKIARDNPGVDPDSIYLEDITEGSYDEKRYNGYIAEWRNK